jgi:hypothetical protein
MNGAEDMIVNHNVVVTEVFRRLSKRLDRSCIAAKFDLRINDASFHRPLPQYLLPVPQHVAVCPAIMHGSDQAPFQREKAAVSSSAEAVNWASTFTRSPACNQKCTRSACR